MLNFFNIKQDIAPNNYKYTTVLKRSKKKIDIFLDNFRLKKKFIFEKNVKSNGKKIVNNLVFPDKNNLSKTLYVSGYFENQDYFCDLRNDLVKMYKPLPIFLKKDLNIIDKLANSNSVSIHIRRHRYSEQDHEKKKTNLNMTKKFTNDLLIYIKKSVNFFEKNIDNPKFFIWSNDFTDMEIQFDKSKFTFITNNDVINDFDLFSYSKHFIVGASTFHWWGAWLNENENKICLRPANLNPSGNRNFYPSEWIKI